MSSQHYRCPFLDGHRILYGDSILGPAKWPYVISMSFSLTRVLTVAHMIRTLHYCPRLSASESAEKRERIFFSTPGWGLDLQAPLIRPYQCVSADDLNPASPRRTPGTIATLPAAMWTKQDAFTLAELRASSRFLGIGGGALLLEAAGFFSTGLAAGFFCTIRPLPRPLPAPMDHRAASWSAPPSRCLPTRQRKCLAYLPRF